MIDAVSPRASVALSPFGPWDAARTLARDYRDEESPNFLEIVEAITYDIAQNGPCRLIPAYSLTYRTESVFKNARAILTRAARVTFAKIGCNGSHGSIQLAGNAFSHRLSAQGFCILPGYFEQISRQTIRSHTE